MLQQKFEQKIKTHILCSVKSLPTPPHPPKKKKNEKHATYNNVEKYGTAGQALDDNIIRRMRFVCWIIKAANTRSEYVTHIAFQRQQW
jgi:hypothetical protein